jgi:hypothetical protein
MPGYCCEAHPGASKVLSSLGHSYAFDDLARRRLRPRPDAADAAQGDPEQTLAAHNHAAEACNWLASES